MNRQDNDEKFLNEEEPEFRKVIYHQNKYQNQYNFNFNFLLSEIFHR